MDQLYVVDWYCYRSEDDNVEELEHLPKSSVDAH